ncbi:Minf_1886 family protein [Gemmatimonadota bacterium]
MTELQFADEILERLQERNPRFHGNAYLFLLSALNLVLEGLDEPRHISGEELANGARELALKLYGPMARTVLGHWGIHSTEDLGEVVFGMVECGVLIRREEDSQEDFRGLFDFEEAFELDYPWGKRV